ncbi:ribonuclease H-like domain-containing protein [Mycena rebaudengoi]|nr:ribonuclease H-like domain-containing protein [Mycena rebaudengoi]
MADIIDLACGSETGVRHALTTFFLQPLYDVHSIFTYTIDEKVANGWLEKISTGKIGLDTEFTKRIIDSEEIQAIGEEPTRADKLRFLRARFSSGFKIEWDNIATCIIQVAYREHVLIMDIKRMRAFPVELRRVLASGRIVKSLINALKDCRILYEDFGVEMRRMVEVGLMVKYTYAERYRDDGFRGTELALETCVADVLGCSLDKGPQKTKWNKTETLTTNEIKYAGLDAQATLEVYEVIVDRIREKELDLGRIISDDWYTLHYLDGAPTRIFASYTGGRLSWHGTLCPWYQSGEFERYV